MAGSRRRPTSAPVIPPVPEEVLAAVQHVQEEMMVPMLDADLQAIVDSSTETPQMRAKMTRYAFAARGWPNADHPGSVRDFLVEHGVPVDPIRR
jgi:hypothetical protein